MTEVTESESGGLTESDYASIVVKDSDEVVKVPAEAGEERAGEPAELSWESCRRSLMDPDGPIGLAGPQRGWLIMKLSSFLRSWGRCWVDSPAHEREGTTESPSWMGEVWNFGVLEPFSSRLFSSWIALL